MLKTILLSILACISIGLYAQDSTTNNTLKSNQIFLGGNGFVSNNHVYSMCDLENRLITNPSAYKEYGKYRLENKLSKIPSLLWLAGAIGGLATLNSNNNLSGKLFLASFVPLFVGVHIDNRSGKHLRNAVAIYNGQY